MTFQSTYYRLNLEEKKQYLISKIKYDKSRICRRAYWLVHNEGLDQSKAMIQAWEESRFCRKDLKYELDRLCDPIKITHGTNEDHNRFMETVVMNEKNRILTLD